MGLTSVFVTEKIRIAGSEPSKSGRLNAGIPLVPPDVMIRNVCPEVLADKKRLPVLSFLLGSVRFLLIEFLSLTMV